MDTGGGMQRWKSVEGVAEDVAEKDKLPLKNYALCDSFDTLLHSIIRRHVRAVYLGMCPVQNGVRDFYLGMCPVQNGVSCISALRRN